MVHLRDLIGHPGLAPFVWWAISLVAVIQLLYFAAGIWRYWRLRAQPPEVKHRVLLPLAGLICLNTSAAFLLAMVHLSSISDVPLPVVGFSIVLIFICLIVLMITT